MRWVLRLVLFVGVAFVVSAIAASFVSANHTAGTADAILVVILVGGAALAFRARAHARSH